jgi:predicted amidohydrolase
MLKAGRYDTLWVCSKWLSVGLEVQQTMMAVTAQAARINTVSVGYTMGAMTVSYDADDQATQNYDAKVTYTMGGTVLSAGTDEMRAIMSVSQQQLVEWL